MGFWYTSVLRALENHPENFQHAVNELLSNPDDHVEQSAVHDDCGGEGGSDGGGAEMGELTEEDDKKMQEDLAVLVDAMGYKRVTAERLLKEHSLESAIKILSSS